MKLLLKLDLGLECLPCKVVGASNANEKSRTTRWNLGFSVNFIVSVTYLPVDMFFIEGCTLGMPCWYGVYNDDVLVVIIARYFQFFNFNFQFLSQIA